MQGKENEERVESPIRTMRKRFEDVSSWATYVILTQLLPDERRAAFGCLLRVAITCWNIGNFIGAKEIITGLRWVCGSLMIRKNEIYYVTLEADRKVSFTHARLHARSRSFTAAISTIDMGKCRDEWPVKPTRKVRKFTDEKSFSSDYACLTHANIARLSAGVSFSLQWWCYHSVGRRKLLAFDVASSIRNSANEAATVTAADRWCDWEQQLNWPFPSVLNKRWSERVKWDCGCF